MQETAWILRSDPKRKQVGFVKASDLKPKDRCVLHDEGISPGLAQPILTDRKA